MTESEGKKISGEYRIVDTYRCNISPCLDCRYCWKNNGCAKNDEMQEIYKYIQACDNILIALPLYFSELTGKLLDVGSRLYGGLMHEEIIQSFAEQNHIDTLKIVDITSLTLEENREYPYAILLIKALPKEYIEKLNQEKETDYTIFVNYENKTDELADKLIAVIQKEGYKAISQSENGIDIRGEYDEKTKSSTLPHKKIAIMSGIGWIGKNKYI